MQWEPATTPTKCGCNITVEKITHALGCKPQSVHFGDAPLANHFQWMKACWMPVTMCVGGSMISLMGMWMTSIIVMNARGGALKTKHNVKMKILIAMLIIDSFHFHHNSLRMRATNIVHQMLGPSSHSSSCFPLRLERSLLMSPGIGFFVVLFFVMWVQWSPSACPSVVSVHSSPVI